MKKKEISWCEVNREDREKERDWNYLLRLLAACKLSGSFCPLCSGITCISGQFDSHNQSTAFQQNWRLPNYFNKGVILLLTLIFFLCSDITIPKCMHFVEYSFKTFDGRPSCKIIEKRKSTYALFK